MSRDVDVAEIKVVDAGTGEIVHVDPRTATAEELRTFALTAREWVHAMTEDQLDELEAQLVAVAKRLRQLGRDAAEAETSRVIALRRIGELLGPGQPGRPSRTWEDNHKKTWEDDHKTALTQAQRDRRKYARLLDEFGDFVDKEIAEQLAKDKPSVSVSRLVKLCQRRRSARNVPMPDRRYSILYVDPPWRYEGAESGTRQIENQYGTMPLDEIKELEVPAADDAVLFFWVTSPKLADGLAVLKAWEFEYRTCMVWIKDKIGMGYYARQQHELLLIAKRGSLPVPAPERRPSSIIRGERTEHSAKPESVYELIESMYAEYERSDEATDFCELFAREKREGWDRWGLNTAVAT